MVGGNSGSRMALPPLFRTEASVAKSEAEAIGSEWLRIFFGNESFNFFGAEASDSEKYNNKILK